MKKSLEIIRLICGGLLLLAAVILGEESSLAMAAAFLSLIICGYEVVFSAFAHIFKGKIFDETVLMSLSAIAAACIGEAHEGAAVMFFYCLGEFIQDKADERTQSSLEKLGGTAESKIQKLDRFISLFAKIYTPVIVAAAAITAFVPPAFGNGTLAEWGEKGLSILVIACPCAIVASVPLAFVCSQVAMLRRGIVFSNGGAIRTAAHMKNMPELIEQNGALSAEGLFCVKERALVPYALKRSKRTMLVIYENVVLFCMVKAAAMVFTVMGTDAGMWLAVLSDAGLLIIAVLNSLRLLLK